MNLTCFNMLQEENIVFFVHLLGIDTNGHSKKPHSKEYKQNIILVDNIVREINEVVADYFNHDNATAFVFTSDQ